MIYVLLGLLIVLSLVGIVLLITLPTRLDKDRHSAKRCALGDHNWGKWYWAGPTSGQRRICKSCNLQQSTFDLDMENLHKDVERASVKRYRDQEGEALLASSLFQKA